MDIEQVELDPTTLAVVRERVAIAELAPFYDRAYGQVAAALGAAGLSPAGPAVGWYASMPGSDVEVAAGFPVRPGDVPLGTELDGAELQTVPGGPAVAPVRKASGTTPTPTCRIRARRAWRRAAPVP